MSRAPSWGIRRLFFRTLLSGIVAVLFISSCNKKNQEPEVIDNPQEAVLKLNKNVEGLKDLAAGIVAADSIAIFSIQYNEDGSVLYRLNLKEGGDVDLYSEIVTHKILVPELSMNQVGDDFYWTVNGSNLTDQTGNRIAVADESMPISFHLQDNTIYCKVRETIIGEYPMTKADYLARDVALDYDIDQNLFLIHLSSGYDSALHTVIGFHLLKDDVPNRSYYKDIFLDAGIGLSSRTSLAAASYLKLSLEGVSFSRSNPDSEEIVLQNEILSGNQDDENGRLLYPDGQPRYKLLFVNGGSSITHGKSLNEKALDNMRRFVENGGSYVGTCAGAFFASNGYDNHYDYSHYLSIWPGMMVHTGLNNEYTGIIISEKSPLLRYYDFGNDHYVDSVRHNAGGYPVDLPKGTEILAYYDTPGISKMHEKPSVWAYKHSVPSGRIVQTGSHPEEIWYGERRDLTAAMILYALEGRGPAAVKGYLKKGVRRNMDKKTADNDPDYTRIGDKQTHHFAVYIPPGAKNVSVDLSSLSNFNLALMMNQDTYAFPESAEYVAKTPGSIQHLSFDSIKEGIWYIAVQCLSTVDVENVSYGQLYVKGTEVLNGVPYSIVVNWDE
jgi:hypothetical protein